MACDCDQRFVSDSQAEQVQVIMPPHLNGYGNLFGGQLAMWIDVLAGVVAKRHSCSAVTTAAIDNLQFHHPVRQGDMVVLKGRMTHVGTTSMEVRVDSYVESPKGEQKLINTAFVIYVALGEDGRPCRVPRLIPRTPQEEKDFEDGAIRREMRLKLEEKLAR